MKTASLIIAGIFSLLVLAVLSILGYERYYTLKFNHTPEGITMANIKEDWGRPDADTIMDGSRRMLIYNKSLMGDSYWFEFTQNGKIVIAKYLDD